MNFCGWIVIPVLALFLTSPLGAQESLWTPAEVLQWVRSYHPRITAAELNREGAAALAQGSGKQPNPQIKLSLSRGTVQEDANALTQRFEIAGQPSLRKEIALNLHEQANQETKLATRAVLLESLTAYYELWVARRSLEISAVHHDLAHRLKEAARQRLATGQISQDEYRRSELQNLSALAQLQQIASRALAAEVSFKALLGLPEEQPLTLPSGPTPPSLRHLPLPPSQQIASTVDHLPELEIAEFKARQAGLEADLAGKAGAPDLYIYAYRGNYNRISQQGIQFGVSFPLFDWGRLGAEHKQKKLVAASLAEETDSLRRELKAKLLKALTTCQGQARYVELLEQQFREREVLAEHGLLAYELGLMSLLEVTDTQKNYHSTLLELAQESATLETQRLSLHLLSGGALEEITRETP